MRKAWQKKENRNSTLRRPSRRANLSRMHRLSQRAPPEARINGLHICSHTSNRHKGVRGVDSRESRLCLQIALQSTLLARAEKTSTFIKWEWQFCANGGVGKVRIEKRVETPLAMGSRRPHNPRGSIEQTPGDPCQRIQSKSLRCFLQPCRE